MAAVSRAKLLNRFGPMDLAYLRSLSLPICNVCEPTAKAHCEGASIESIQHWESLQHKLRAQLQDVDDSGWSLESLRRVGGLDISFETGTNRATAVLVVCELKVNTGNATASALSEIYEDAVDVDMDLPYISGFLFVREVFAYELLLQRLRESAPHLEPDIFLVDGSGIFHPRQCGSASHFGISNGLRTIGVAKKLLCFDDFDKVAGEQVEQHVLSNFGESIPLVGSSGFVYGLALRTAYPAKAAKDASSKRVYVSVGNRLSLASTKDVILKCCDVGGSYLPEPIRLADLTGRAIERTWKHIHSGQEARQMTMDVSNLLDNKSRKTLLDMLVEVDLDPHQRLVNVQPEVLRRKLSTVEDLFLPFQAMHPDVEVGVLITALRIEKPWAANLRKETVCKQKVGKAMRVAS